VPHTPDADERRTVGAAATIAALAIERHRAEAALTRAAQVDPLTGLPNRAVFLDQIRRRLRPGRHRVAVMFLDLDRFKWVNDSLGHGFGDRILIQVAARLTQALGSGHLIARFGGDEFTILLDDATDERITATVTACQSAIATPFSLDGGEFFLTASVGVAVNEDPAEAEALVRDADVAMYAAKERGRARCVRFDQGLRQDAVRRVQLEGDLRRAVVGEELVLHYQPGVHLASGRWTGVEGLLRWNHPERGALQPNDFIPLAEETGLIVPLGEQVLQTAVAQAARWNPTGAEGIHVAVNVSVLQLAHPALIAAVEGLLTRHGVRPDLLVVEVTETAVMQELQTARQVLDGLSALGVRLLIDDFGIGWSSIARLRELPFEGVKIDRSFVHRLGTDPAVEGVLAAIIDLAHALGLDAIAEGVDTATALCSVAELGCDFAQGFYLSPPVPADQLLAVLATPPPSLH
jgi:diguanylate cyclase (GGDEF)-like protein